MSEGTRRTAAQWQEIIPDGGPVQQAMVAAILADLAEYEKKWDILARHQNVLQDELATLEERFRKMAEQDRGDLQMLSDQLAAAESRIAALERIRSMMVKYLEKFERQSEDPYNAVYVIATEALAASPADGLIEAALQRAAFVAGVAFGCEKLNWNEGEIEAEAERRFPE